MAPSLLCNAVALSKLLSSTHKPRVAYNLPWRWTISTSPSSSHNGSASHERDDGNFDRAWDGRGDRGRRQGEGGNAGRAVQGAGQGVLPGCEFVLQRPYRRGANEAGRPCRRAGAALA